MGVNFVWLCDVDLLSTKIPGKPPRSRRRFYGEKRGEANRALIPALSRISHRGLGLGLVLVYNLLDQPISSPNKKKSYNGQ